jgi:hypothetical protein
MPMTRLRRLAQPLVVPLKIATLVVVFVRFRGTWVGASVVLGMGLLLFGVDRSVRRWVARLAGGK